VITIAHRLNTIKRSDRIAVIGKREQGEVFELNDKGEKEKKTVPSSLLEYGAPLELEKVKDGHYAKLINDLKKE
jgi:hypothetical protein